MPLSEKELEIFLWEQPLSCEARGLHIAQGLFAAGRRYRQVPMGRCGVAQQVRVCFEPRLNCYHVQVVACTARAVTSATYRQAQQQLTALRYLLQQTIREAGVTAAVQTSCALIGRKVELAGELAAALADSPTYCQAFTYRYEVDGLQFEAVGAQGHLFPAEQAALGWLAADLLAERGDALARSEATAGTTQTI